MRIANSVKCVVGVVAGVALVGCMSNEPKKAMLECAFPDSPSIEAPGWICDMPVEGVAVSAVGSHRKTAAGHQFQKEQAAMAGRNELARQMQVKVKSMLKNFTETTGVGDAETVDTVSSSVSKNITATTLEGSKIFRSLSNPETGMMYVLVGLDPENAAQKTQAAIKTSMKNERALWQKFQSQKSHEELEAEVEKFVDSQF